MDQRDQRKRCDKTLFEIEHLLMHFKVSAAFLCAAFTLMGPAMKGTAELIQLSHLLRVTAATAQEIATMRPSDAVDIAALAQRIDGIAADFDSLTYGPLKGHAMRARDRDLAFRHAMHAASRLPDWQEANPSTENKAKSGSLYGQERWKPRGN